MKKLIALILILSVLFTSTVSFAFSDVESTHWAKEYIERIADAGIMNDKENDILYPDHVISNIGFIRIITSVFLEVDTIDVLDSSSAWLKEYNKKGSAVSKLADGPSLAKAALRADVAYVIANMISLEPSEELNFSDADTIPETYRDDIAALVSAGLMNGYEDGTIRGDAPITRAELAALLIRALDYKASHTTLGSTLFDMFNVGAIKGKSTLEIAEAIIQSPSIPFVGGVMPVEEGFLSGFDDYEVKGFKSGAMFAPMIGSIPFVGYVFELENKDDVTMFAEGLEANANLRWNICVSADEMITGYYDNKVFFVMCPSSFEEQAE